MARKVVIFSKNGGPYNRVVLIHFGPYNRVLLYQGYDEKSCFPHPQSS